ncbi:zinc-binding dehydrogenase [Salinibacterium sp. ZJ454]|uniref:zinc-binding dehydrogenase n=1 Tax=Salinibacterium sp. ZJ454 TaxID=2708339 RepID=UPI0014215AFC|nr:zinc-binding dehydrogenase [Salinibacterium sp. ZJ454]
MIAMGRAAVVREYNAPLEIVEYPVPEPEPGAIVVRIDTTTVCGSDVHGWEGAYEGVLPVELPLILGHEAVGVVVALGEGAERDSVGHPVRVGDRLVWAAESCGKCWACTVSKRTTLCPNRRLGMLASSAPPPHFTGMFAEYGYVWPKAGRLRVPDGIKSEWASVATCAVRTVVNAVELAGRIDYQHTVVVQGSGPVGLFATALISTHEPQRLIVVGAPDDRLAIARQWGADHTVSIVGSTPESRLSEVMEQTGGHGSDLTFEASGARGAIEEGLAMSARAGRYVLIGATGKGTQEISPHYIINRGLSVLGSFSGDIDSYYKAFRFLLANRDRFDFDAVIGETHGLDDVTGALEAMRSQSDIKPVIKPGLS